MFSQSFLYLAWYMTMSVLGHYNNFFFAAHLLDIAMGFKTLRTILSSVTHNGKQVCYLLLILCYLYVFRGVCMLVMFAFTLYDYIRDVLKMKNHIGAHLLL